MTKTTGPKSRKKYNHVYPQSTYKHRADLIETRYIKGVYNDDGEQVIRPVDAEALEFMDQFYKETVHLSFNGNSTTKQLVKDIRNLIGQHSKWKRSSTNRGKTNPEIEAQIEKKKEEFRVESKRLGNLHCDYDQQAAIRASAYQNKQCIYTNKKITNKLDSFETEEYCYSDQDNETFIEDLITSGEDD